MLSTPIKGGASGPLAGHAGEAASGQSRPVTALADQGQQASAIDGAEDLAVPGNSQHVVHPGTGGRR
jgi:hypothetical protein